MYDEISQSEDGGGEPSMQGDESSRLIDSRALNHTPTLQPDDGLDTDDERDTLHISSTWESFKLSTSQLSHYFLKTLKILNILDFINDLALIISRYITSPFFSVTMTVWEYGRHYNYDPPFLILIN